MPDKTFGQTKSDELIHVDREVSGVCFAPKDLCKVENGVIHLPVPATVGGLKLKAVHGQVVTAGGSGTMEIQVRNVTKAVNMLTTLLTIDAGEKGSNTAVTPAVIDTNNDGVDEHDELRVDINVIHTAPAAEGLVTRLTFGKP